MRQETERARFLRRQRLARIQRDRDARADMRRERDRLLDEADAQPVPGTSSAPHMPVPDVVPAETETPEIVRETLQQARAAHETLHSDTSDSESSDSDTDLENPRIDLEQRSRDYVAFRRWNKSPLLNESPIRAYPRDLMRLVRSHQIHELNLVRSGIDRRYETTEAALSWLTDSAIWREAERALDHAFTEAHTGTIHERDELMLKCLKGYYYCKVMNKHQTNKGLVPQPFKPGHTRASGHPSTRQY